MPTGQLRHRLDFQSKAITQDGTTGAVTEAWTTTFTVWGLIDPVSGRESLLAQQVNATYTHTVTVRYRTELADPRTVASMRILYGSRIFTIKSSMNENERNRMITMQVEEGPSND